MHIRKLDLYGFKSFPDHTAFTFDPGVSGVVGPNGCGKSNVVDAVVWVLGEQSARVLRGRAMEDVIFAGSAERAPMSFAEVSITFEAGQEPFPGEWSHHAEIQIARRLYRDGNSEYMLNQQKVRLKDIHDLFLDTGVSNRMYSVIEQGRIGEIVNAKPEQRRALIEEAAGISRYKARKKEAEQKLDETFQNLSRVSEVTDELGKRLRTLERQVEKATKFRRLRTRVRQAETYLGLARFAALSGDRKALGEQLRAATTEEESLIRRTAQREADIGLARTALDAREGVVGGLRDRLAEVEASRREAESARQYQARESGELSRRLQVLGEQRTRAEGERDEASRLLQEAIRERGEVEQALVGLEQRAVGSRSAADAAERALGDRRRRVEEGKAAVMARVTELARARATREALLTRRSELDARLTQVMQRQTDVGVDLSALASAESSAAEAERQAGAALDQAKAAFERARAELDGSEKARLAAVAELKRAREALARDERHEQGLRARLDSLLALQARHEGVEDGVRAALSVKGTLGTLAEHLDVPAALEVSLGVVLGEALSAVLVPDEATAVTARAAARGRVLILPLNGAAPPAEGFGARIGGTDVGRAALGRLLGSCGEAPDLATALAWHRERGQPCLSACGAFVADVGAVVLGSAPGAGALLLARRREIASLQTEVDAGTAQVHAREAELAAASAFLDVATAEADAARGSQEQARVAAGETELALRDAGMLHRERVREHGRQRDHARLIAKEEGEIRAALADADQREAALGAAIQSGERGQDQAEMALKAHQEALGGEEGTALRAREALARIAAEIAGLRERLVGLRRAEAASGAGQAAAERQVASCLAEAQGASARLAVLAEDDRRLEAVIFAQGAEQDELRTHLDAEREAVRAERAALHDAEAKIKGIREKCLAAARAREELERQTIAVREEITRIRDQIEERYQISVAGMLDRIDRDGHVVIEVDEAALGPQLPGDDGARWAGIEPVEDLRITKAMLEDVEAIQRWMETLTRSRERLADVGEVNLVAVVEYSEVAAEHATLDAQRGDLDASVKAIRQTIARLNRTCRERFRETFDRVDAYFRDLYPRLVGGGQARLVLTDEEDLLETGVDVYVQPPGKRLQHLSLLSGGETAMTAIALLFSLFREKPSPFCLLDEVDAPLDEGNGARFNGLLKEMALSSQFIVITHNKKTMECMDTLYGVTMPAPGVSKLVTVRLS